MKRILSISTLILSVALIGTSCKKSCVAEEDTNSGAIIHTVNEKKVILYPHSGYITSNMGGSSYILQEGDTYSEGFDVSFDGGQTRQPVDYTKYNVIANPRSVKCDVAFQREVIIDDINQTVTYTVEVQECDNGCDDIRTVENWVLIPKVPTGYFVWCL